MYVQIYVRLAHKRERACEKLRQFYQSISGSRAIIWKFRSVKCIGEHVELELDAEEKAGVKELNSKKGFEKNEHALSMEKLFEFSDSTQNPLPVRT